MVYRQLCKANGESRERISGSFGMFACRRRRRFLFVLIFLTPRTLRPPSTRPPAAIRALFMTGLTWTSASDFPKITEVGEGNIRHDSSLGSAESDWRRWQPACAVLGDAWLDSALFFVVRTKIAGCNFHTWAGKRGRARWRRPSLLPPSPAQSFDSFRA